jgi:hypothetical protein
LSGIIEFRVQIPVLNSALKLCQLGCCLTGHRKTENSVQILIHEETDRALEFLGEGKELGKPVL